MTKPDKEAATKDFHAGDLVYWVHRSGDKALCTVKEIKDEYSMWVVWHKDGFVNIMPKSGFILAESNNE